MDQRQMHRIQGAEVTDLPDRVGEFTPHPENPRQCDRPTLADLKKSMLRYGDLGGITWNRRTGHLVSGHQRVSRLPKGSKVVYRPWPGDQPRGEIKHKGNVWPVRVVDWDETMEREAMVVANADWLQGVFDPEAMEELLRLPEVDHKAMFLDDMVIEEWFDPEAVEAILGRPGIHGGEEPAEVQGVMDELEKMSRADIRQQEQERAEDMRLFRVIKCESDVQAEEVMRALGLEADAKYVSGEWLLKLLAG